MAKPLPFQMNTPVVDARGCATAYFAALQNELQLASAPPVTFSGTIVTAKLTPAGANGSITFVNGTVVSQVPAT
jgi:hypothetical protein